MATPTLQTPTLEILPIATDHKFMIPVKKINEGKDVSHFLTSKAYRDIMTFLLQLNRAIFPVTLHQAGQRSRIMTWDINTPNEPNSNTTLRLGELIEKLNELINEVPPDTVTPRRFGNISFRRWHEVLEERATDMLKDYLPSNVSSQDIADSECDAISEIKAYFLGSFGSAQRLDYGTGHELSFLAFLGCLWKLGGFQMEMGGAEERQIVLGVIDKYLTVIRRLILTYTLEPAGSHGVWGLDDHSFLPYIFGSAQYAPPIEEFGQVPMEGSRPGAPKPGDIVDTKVVEKERQTNMYFGAIGFIYDVKKGPFWEHSPTLYDISGVPAGWAKINKGMLKMYNAEVLSKFPVVQHFSFGSLFSWDKDPNAEEPTTSVHTVNQPCRNGGGPASVSANRESQHTMHSMRAPWSVPQTGIPSTVSTTRAPWAAPMTDPHIERISTTRPLQQFPTPSDTRAPWAVPQIPIDDGSTSMSRRLPTSSDTRAPLQSKLPSAPSNTQAPWATPVRDEDNKESSSAK